MIGSHDDDVADVVNLFRMNIGLFRLHAQAADDQVDFVELEAPVQIAGMSEQQSHDQLVVML